MKVKSLIHLVSTRIGFNQIKGEKNRNKIPPLPLNFDFVTFSSHF